MLLRISSKIPRPTGPIRNARSFSSQSSSQTCQSSNFPNFDPKPNIIGIPKEKLTKELLAMGMEEFRVGQVWKWLYNKGVTSFSGMDSLSKIRREELNNKYSISHGLVSKDSLSEDGTRKILLKLDNDEVETVFIPETHRGTICVSSQVGCTFSCTFCYTGTQKIKRNLKAGEIISQVLTMKDLLFDYSGTGRLLTNVVFMGQGEPFYNYNNVAEAITLLLDNTALSFSRRRITVSTSGVVPKIKQLGKDFPGVGLAISLHATTNQLRSEIVPANQQWPLEELMSACRNHPEISQFNKITFEYVLLKGVNDSNEDARRLANMLKDFPSLVNVIPFNPWPGSRYETPSNNKVHEFARIVEENGVQTTIRWPRGRDILAACGQLTSKKEIQS